MPDFRIRNEYLELVKVISEKNKISQDEVVETALAMFFKMYFSRFDMYPELEIARRESEYQEMEPEQIREKINNEKTVVAAAIAEAERLGLL